VIAAETKSGTNQIHGSAFDYRRDHRLAARDPFAQANPIPGGGGAFIPPTLWNQFGGSVGGPIRKDKMFYFGDYQGNRQHTGGSPVPRGPTPAARAGGPGSLCAPILKPRRRDESQRSP